MKKMLPPAFATGAVFAFGFLIWQIHKPIPAAPSMASSDVISIKASPASRGESRLSTQPSLPHDSLIAEAEAPELSPERRCLALAERDPREALVLAIESHLGDTKPGLIGNLTAQWAARDFDAALAWVRQMESGDQRDELFARLVFVASKSDPAAAAHLVIGEITPGSRQEEAAISVLHQWALRDLPAAAAWAAAFPAGELSERARSEIEGLRATYNAASRGP